MLKYLYTFLAIAILFSACKDDGDCVDEITITATKPNILLIIADDLGKDAITGYDEGTTKPNTPTLDSIRMSGLTFDNFWVYPTCSPTRASIITGKYGYRTEVKKASEVLNSDEIVLQQYINDKTNNAYSTAIVGKWHLSGNKSNTNPEDFGIDYYEGLIKGAAEDYYSWTKTSNGSTNTETEYITTKFTNLAIEWVQEQDKPWFLWQAYTAPHTPFHAPPAGTHSQGTLAPYQEGDEPLPYYHAAIESMDYEIGRLLNSMTATDKENLIILFIGDNGSPNQVAQSPYSSRTVKGTVYQGGINTPLFIAGKGVTRRGRDANLVNSTDLFATIASLAGATTNAIYDSKSIVELLTTDKKTRDFQYSELRNNDGSEVWTIRNMSYKLIVNSNDDDQLYDLRTDPYEKINLLNNSLDAEATMAKELLEAELLLIRN
ncbi:MAG: sulfatase-like hydrolase/transferase [Bacteroidia bacterium]|jgi:arylsulfatase A-like enzyme|tara:strand:+ start:4945 stop:6243 length:1299 start_codon:yes stop_codon:yes gene_type:complete